MSSSSVESSSSLVTQLAKLYTSPALDILRKRASSLVQEIVLRRVSGESTIFIIRGEKLQYWTLIAEELLRQVKDIRLLVHVENSILRECKLETNPVTKSTYLTCEEARISTGTDMNVLFPPGDVVASVQYVQRLMRKSMSPIAVLYVLYSDDALRRVLYYTLCEVEASRDFLTRGHMVVIYVPLDVEIPPACTVPVLDFYTGARPEDVHDLVTKLGSEYEEIRRLSPRDVEQIAQICTGVDLAFLEAKIRQICERYRRARVITREEFSTYLRKLIEKTRVEVVKRELGFVEIVFPREGLGKVAGLENIKNFIYRTLVVPFKNFEKAKDMGLDLPRGLLFFGPEGTGKTHLAKAIAGELGVPMVRFSLGSVLDPRLGMSERLMRKLLTVLPQLAPCILFIDEVDQLGQRAGLVDADAGTTRRLFGMFLEWLGDEDARRDIIVIGTTNMPELLDPAFVRVGRFDYIVPVLYPDHETRRAILLHYLKSRRASEQAIEIVDNIVDMTVLWTCAELRFLIDEACRISLREGAEEITEKALLEAVKNVRVNYDERFRRLEHYVNLARRMCNIEELVTYCEKVLEEAKRGLARGGGSRLSRLDVASAVFT